MDLNQAGRGKIFLFIDTKPGTIVKVAIIDGSETKFVLVLEVLDKFYQVVLEMTKAAILAGEYRVITFEERINELVVV